LNFECAEGWLLGAVGAVFLVGIVVGCSFVTKMGDVYGRRPVYLAGLLLNFVLILTLILTHQAWVTFICLFFLGISITARYYVGYTFNLEFQPKKTQVAVSTIQFVSESLVYLIDIAYFSYISKNWVWLQIPNLILSFVGIVFVWWMPESPRYYIARKQYDKARAVFSRIAATNGIKRANSHEFIFEQEAAAQIDDGFGNEESQVKVSWKDLWQD
jgi:MFS family permease